MSTLASILRITANATEPLLALLRGNPLVMRLASGAGWSLLGTVASRAAQGVSFVVVARLVGKTDFGAFGIVQSTAATVGTLCSFAIGLTAARFVAQFRSSDPLRAGRVVGMSFAVAIFIGVVATTAMVTLACPIAAWTLAAPHLAPLLQISAAAIFLTCVNGAQSGVLAGFEAFRATAISNMLSAFLSVPFTLLFAVRLGLFGAVLGLAVTALMTCIAGQVALRRVLAHWGIRADLVGWVRETRILYMFSAPVALTGILTAPVAWFANTILIQLPSGYSEMGLFGAAQTFRAALLFVPLTIQNACFPALVAAYSRGSDEYRQTVAVTHNYVSVPTVFMAVLAMYWSPLLIGLFGRDFTGAVPVLQVLMLSVAIQAIGTAVGATIQVRGRVWGGLVLNIVWGVSLLIVAWLTAGQLGASALALANAVAYGILLFAQLWWQRRYLDGCLPPALVRSFCLLTIATIGARLSSSAPTWAGVPLGLLVALIVTRAAMLRSGGRRKEFRHTTQERAI